ncbi:MAG: Uma2 family endonuclease [Vicinamibacterales bacterium]
MSRIPLDHPATYDDLVALPEHVVAEIVDGELHASPRPAPRHAVAHSALGMLLGPPFQHGRSGPGGWRILDEPELHFGADVLVPDLAGWRRERMPRIPRTAYFSVAPDWVCEVLSPSTAVLDRARKLRIYAREGVGHAWLIDPVLQTLEILTLSSGHWAIVDTFAGTTPVRAEPFDAIDLELALLWSDLDEEPSGGDGGSE